VQRDRQRLALEGPHRIALQLEGHGASALEGIDAQIHSRLESTTGAGALQGRHAGHSAGRSLASGYTCSYLGKE
jgi:hypothetical protein